ncbi:hypothetical protein LPJ61_000969 [Coemansia biformis]|uniref:MFS general substrate transporter n=1 Tax=Coemansia biformis TaxID=1286918 RepID=A0A9W7YAV5_9FUNG|nr:hypothetical protein LPJ61_000969 [Coemansia biformis]
MGYQCGRVAYTLSDYSSSLMQAFVAASLGVGLVSAHGVFQGIYQDQFADGAQAQLVALVGALQLGCFIGLRPLAAAVGARFGRHVTLALGVVLSSGGLLAAGVASEIWQLCLAQGVLVGAGASACETAGVTMSPLARDVAHWAVVGAGIGGGALALVAGALAQSLGSTALALRWLALTVFVGQLSALLLLGRWSAFVPREPAGDKLGYGAAGASGQPKVTTSAFPGPRRNVARRAWLQLTQDPGSVLGMAGDVLHSMGAPLPLLYLPSYASLLLQAGGAPLPCAAPLVLLCVASAAGAPLARALLTRHCQSPVLLLGAARAGASLAMWCLWLPAGSSWLATCSFALVYGLMLGTAGYARRIAEDDHSAPARIAPLAASAAALAGAAAAAWLVATPDRSPPFMPLIAFAAAATLAAAAATVASAACSNSKSRITSLPVTCTGW